MHETLLSCFQNSFNTYTNEKSLQWSIKPGEYTSYTFAEVKDQVYALATGLIGLGAKPQEHIALFADVSHLWMISNLGIQFANGVDVPRGTDSTEDELAYIVEHAETSIVFIHTFQEKIKIETALKNKKSSHKIKYYIVMNDKIEEDSSNTISLSVLLEHGKQHLIENDSIVQEFHKRIEGIRPTDLATIIYTSGTTGTPKGVMLTQSNLTSQLLTLEKVLDTYRGQDLGLTLLPPWHIFGRIIEYFLFFSGITISYSSILTLGDDMRTLKPTILPAVPRIWEGVYNKIILSIRKQGKEKIFNFFKNIAFIFLQSKKHLLNEQRFFTAPSFFVDSVLKLKSLFVIFLLFPLKKLGDVLVFRKVLAATGGRLRFSISGGGALPSHIDKLFTAIGLVIIEGYGLTETSPVLSLRDPNKIVLGTVGPCIENTEYKLIDSDGNDVTHIPGAKGTLHVKGPQVMKGYYKEPEKTKTVLTNDGWFNTGDLVKLTINKEVTIVGRSKDTIVLLGGENIEPEPIEEKLSESIYIDQIMCVGQDKKTLATLIVPSEENLKEFAEKNSLGKLSFEELVKCHEVIQLIKTEVSSRISAENGFKTFERISKIHLLAKPFEKGLELSNTFKIKRNVVSDIYKKEIEAMYS